MSTALRQVLSYTHGQKRQRGVDGALLRLYEPILWRALSVANADVRRNAATMLIEAFPLQDPSLPLTQVRASIPSAISRDPSHTDATHAFPLQDPSLPLTQVSAGVPSARPLAPSH
jgi:condensin-2 complex subunit G2